MKKSIIGIVAFLLPGVLTCGCGGNDNGVSERLFRWDKVSPRVDSLSQALDMLIARRADGDSIESALTLIEKESAASPGDAELAGRTAYFRAFKLKTDAHPDEADSLLEATIEAVDSAAHPYLYNRLTHLADKQQVRNVAEFDKLSARLAFFERRGDLFFTGAHYTELGNLLKNVRDAEGAVRAYRRADSLYIAAGFPEVAVYNRMNLASALLVQRDTVAALGILDSLVTLPEVDRRREVKAMVLYNLYINSGRREALDSLYAIEEDNPEPMTLVMKSRQSLADGNAAEAVEFAEAATEKGLNEGDGEAVAWALYAAEGAYAALGDTATAYQRLKDASELTDMITLANEPNEIKDEETGRALAMRKLEAELAQNRATLRYVCVAFVLLLLLVAAAWIASARIRRLKERNERSIRERDRLSRHLAATQAAMDESERLITTVGKDIGHMTDSGRLTAGETQKIVNAIKSHSIHQGERETFIESFVAVYPGFSERLRAINPAFTEPDIRLACYIVMGMDTKRIAATMGIRPESVKQARWRLRTKLALEKGASLEATLRSLAE